jgi:hypothetical protein
MEIGYFKKLKNLENNLISAESDIKVLYSKLNGNIRCEAEN